MEPTEKDIDKAKKLLGINPDVAGGYTLQDRPRFMAIASALAAERSELEKYYHHQLDLALDERDKLLAEREELEKENKELKDDLRRIGYVENKFEDQIANLEKQNDELKESLRVEQIVSEQHCKDSLILAENLQREREILRFIYEADLLPMAYAMESGKEIRDVVKEIVESHQKQSDSGEAQGEGK